MAIGATTAAIIGAGITAGSSAASGVIGSRASNRAAETIAAGQQTAADNITDITGQAVATGQQQVADANTYLQDQGEGIADLYDPFIDGTQQDVAALRGLDGELSERFSFDQSDFENTPAYRAILTRGQQAIERSAAAQGGLFGTNTLKRLSDYTVDTTNMQIGDAFNRALQSFQANRQAVGQRAGTLQNLASLALSGTQGRAGALGETATQVNRNMLTGAGMGLQGADTIARAQGAAAQNSAQATAAGQVGSANSWLSALQQGGAALQDFLARRNFSGSSTPSMWEDVTYQGA